MTEAFKPLGVYINFWGDQKPGSAGLRQWCPVQSGSKYHIPIVVINDDDEPVEGRLVLSIERKRALLW